MRTNALLLVLITLAACDRKNIDLGDGSSGAASEPSNEDSGEDDGETTDGATPMAGLGAPCDHDRAPGDLPESVLLTFPTADCSGEVCLYGDSTVAPADACDDSADCNAADPATGRFECDVETHACRLTAEYVAARSFCSGFCESDADCVTDGATTCQTGFSCVPQSIVGAAACRPVCACNDDLDEARAESIRNDCLDGTSPGCTQNPGQGLCPD